MLNHLLQGFHVLVVSDHSELGHLFSALLTACGAQVTRTGSVPEALEALHRHPHVVLFDVELADETWAVPVEASNLRVPIVALTHRSLDPHHVAGPVRALAARLLHSTELETVCKTLHAATTEGP
jgi:CheY-like chemotaxis protein